MKKQPLYYRLLAASLAMTVVALCAGCKPSNKAGGPDNAESAASSAPAAASSAPSAASQ